MFDDKKRNKATSGSGSNNEKINDGIAGYIGMSAPETPKYLLTNNFLLDYFSNGTEMSPQYNFELFEEKGVLAFEDDINRDSLKNSFDSFMECYLGENTMRRENRRLSKGTHFYFPFSPEMLTENGSPNLRHMLFHMQNLDDDFNYTDMQKKLYNYVFNNISGINHILKILLHSQEEVITNKSYPGREISVNFWAMLSSAERKRIKRLGENLNGDLNTLLTHEYFGKLDFYRKYNYLSILLTSYIIQYIVFRGDANTGILCKGAPADSRLNGVIHRACCNNYVEIRNLFPKLLQRYYEEVVKKVANDDGTIPVEARANHIYIKEMDFVEFATGILGSRSKMNDLSYDMLVHAFSLTPDSTTDIPIDDFVVRYINLTGSKRGSVLSKISSTLPTSGRQIEMIFPKGNAKHKYFAMSASLTEFYVRLYLADKGHVYDYLDNFIQYLQSKYRIVLTKTNDTERLLRSVRPKLSAQEFSKNKSAFIDTLNAANCLVKLSDSGYVITLPEKKGVLKLV
ncbi:MAG: hypothetical protein HDR06_03510 [Lachnospiraceae bacterium]|nr:hypothetical protein [Lachnospiraceae bacterium]